MTNILQQTTPVNTAHQAKVDKGPATAAGSSTTTPSATGSSTRTSSTPSPVSNRPPLLEQIPSGNTLPASIKNVEPLSQADKILLQQVNPTLLQALIEKTANLSNQATADKSLAKGLGATGNLVARPAASVFLKQTPLYLLTVNYKQQAYSAISTELFKANTPVLISRDGDSLRFRSVTSSRGQTVETSLVSAIKASLPKQQAVHQLQQFIHNLHKLPAPLQTLLTDKAVIDASKVLANFSFTDNTLSTAAQVREALLHSGIFLENKLSQPSLQKSQQQPQQPSTPLLTQDLRTHLGALQQALAANPKPAKEVSIEQIHAALQALGANISSAVSNSATPPKRLAASTQVLLQLLGIKIPQQQNLQQPSTGLLQHAVKQHLSQLLEQTQARIQLQQLRSLGIETRHTDAATNARQQWHTELPLRFNEQLVPLHISLQQQQPLEEKHSDETTAEDAQACHKKTTQRWQVFLSFELPDDEKLHAQLQLIDDDISATLWAESRKLCRQTQQQLQQLRKQLTAQGLQVDELHCLEGKPPQSELTLTYNLVDIST